MTGGAIELRELEIRYLFSKEMPSDMFQSETTHECDFNESGVLAPDVSMARKLLFISFHAEIGFTDEERKKCNQALFGPPLPELCDRYLAH